MFLKIHQSEPQMFLKSFLKNRQIEPECFLPKFLIQNTECIPFDLSDHVDQPHGMRFPNLGIKPRQRLGGTLVTNEIGIGLDGIPTST